MLNTKDNFKIFQKSTFCGEKLRLFLPSNPHSSLSIRLERHAASLYTQILTELCLAVWL